MFQSTLSTKLSLGDNWHVQGLEPDYGQKKEYRNHGKG